MRVPQCLLATPIDTADDFALLNIAIEGAKIREITPASEHDHGDIDADGGILVPAFVDMHTHLDKGHIWPRKPNPDGTFLGALTAVLDDRAAAWSAADVARRMEFALRAAYHHGTRAIRTHIDTVAPNEALSWPVFADARERWAGRITLQAVSLSAIDKVPADPRPLFDLVNGYGGMVGAVLYPVDAMRERLAALLETAEARGEDIDFHADETLDPSVNCLLAVAEEARRIGFSGRITVGHCCSLMTMSEANALATLDVVAGANIAIVSLPMCNLYLQDRDPNAKRTPRIRGGTLVHEMAAREIPVAFASDNTRDPFYAYGDLDMVEVWREATRTLHLDHPVGDWPRAFSLTPSHIMRLADDGGLRPDAPADLVLFKARDWTELFSRPQVDRTVIRDGAVLTVSLPDYRELN